MRSPSDPAWAALLAKACAADIHLTAVRFAAALRREGPHYVGACPAGCAKKDGFVITPDKRIFLCRPSGASGDAIAMVRHIRSCSFVEAVEFVAGERRDDDRNKKPISPAADISPRPEPAKDGALAVWLESVDPRGIVQPETYFRSRALSFGDDAAVVRWNPRISALVALFRNIHSNERQAVSRTFLDNEGRKIDRKFLGPVGGAAIKLSPDIEVTNGLAIGEGVETCMAARQFGILPVWALGSKCAIAKFPVLSGIETLTILAEPDAAREVDQCARRWYEADREVLINRSLIGTDLNDALRGAA